MSVAHLLDCRTCMSTYPRTERQRIGCGFEAALPGATPWEHEGRELGPEERCSLPRGHAGEHGTSSAPSSSGFCDAPIDATCPGYLCSLPEVLEISHARLHWSKGALGAFADDEKPSRALLIGITILEGESGHAQDWELQNPVKDER